MLRQNGREEIRNGERVAEILGQEKLQ